MMIIRSMNKLYDGPMEALVGIFDLMIENAAPMANTLMIATLFVSGDRGRDDRGMGRAALAVSSGRHGLLLRHAVPSAAAGDGASETG